MMIQIVILVLRLRHISIHMMVEMVQAIDSFRHIHHPDSGCFVLIHRFFLR